LHSLNLQQHPRRFFDDVLNSFQEGDGFTAVDNAMVIRQGDIHHGSDHDRSIAGDRTVLDGVQAALASHGAAPAEIASYPRQTTRVGEAIDKVRAANPQAVVVVGPSNTVAPILKAAHGKGWKPLFLTVSFVGTDELIKQAGSDAEGMVITQVVPPYYLTTLKTVALYRRTLQQYNASARPNFVSFEGFIDAMVLVDGLTKAGKNPTRESLIRAIDTLHDKDMGLGPELKLDYSPKDHKGFVHVIPTVIRGGTAVPFTDWAIIQPK